MWIKNIDIISYIINQFDIFKQDSRPKESDKKKVSVGEKQLFILEKNIIRFRPTNVRLRNILYIPRLDINLISISKLYTKDYVGEFN